MSYSIDTENVVSNNDGTKLGRYDKSGKVFAFFDADKKRYTAQVSKFLSAVGYQVDSWEVEGTEPEDREDETIPPRPKWNPKMGDKTPSYVRWLERYHLDEFKEVYGITGRGVVPIIEDGVKVGMKETWIGRRKTVLSEKADLPHGMDPNLYDINAE